MPQVMQESPGKKANQEYKEMRWLYGQAQILPLLIPEKLKPLLPLWSQFLPLQNLHLRQLHDIPVPDGL
jgi:hypothetical protein